MKFLRKKQMYLQGVEITADFGIDKSAWPDWLINGWRNEQPMLDGSIQPGIVVPDIGNEIRVGTPTNPEIGRPGDYIIRDVRGNLGVATPDVLFQSFEAYIPGQDVIADPFLDDAPVYDING